MKFNFLKTPVYALSGNAVICKNLLRVLVLIGSRSCFKAYQFLIQWQSILIHGFLIHYLNEHQRGYRRAPSRNRFRYRMTRIMFFLINCFRLFICFQVRRAQLRKLFLEENTKYEKELNAIGKAFYKKRI